ncbi:MAG TPA: hypothetical protein VD735_06225 [Candidatus Saccharimonadales bacterium]|nr:hypothetical protein [Candidatus Saccharimonadales bacterium]
MSRFPMLSKLLSRPLIKVRSFGKVPLIIGGAAVLLFVAAGTTVALRSSDERADSNPARDTRTAQPDRDELQTQTEKPAETSAPAEPTPPATATPAVPAQPKAAKPAAPPKPTTPAPNYFNTKITRPGQVAPGTMIYSIKGGNGYFAGELLMSPSTLVYGGEPLNFTVSTPDGKSASSPTNPYDDRSPYFSPAFDSAKYKTSGSSFEMKLVTTGTPPPGTYQVHVTAGYSTNGGNDIWTYHGWLTVIVY